MTAESFAELVNARRCGRGKWQARCPAHQDRSPSLSIAEGSDGRVLVRCWAGCTTKNICAALGITLRDLFAGPPATPRQVALLAAEREAKAAIERHQRAVERAARDRLWKLEQLVNVLGARLARNPEDAELGRLFHRVCDRLHEAETTTNEKRLAVNEPLERTA